MSRPLPGVSNELIDAHLARSGEEDRARVSHGKFSTIFYADTRRIRVYMTDHPLKYRQDMVYHASDSPNATTLTCGHAIKFWDLKRCATPRETARLQGFPDTFVLPKTCYVKLFGNAVTVACAKHALSRVVDGPVRHLDVCAGIGGFSVALRQLSPESSCVGFSEIMPAAKRCYVANDPQAPDLGDATEIQQWPTADLLTAGFPCQPFSVASTHECRARHAHRMFFRIVLDAIRSSGATRVVLENVAGILTQGRDCFDELISTLERDGFTVEYGVLMATEFGVPQLRKRLYIAARRDGVPPLKMRDDLPEPIPTSLRSVIET